MSKKKKKDTPKGNVLSMDISFGKVPLTEVALFAEHLSVMLKAGLTIADALVIAQQSAKGKMKRVIKHLIKSVQAGNAFADSLGQHPKVFSGLFINSVRAGEAGGTLDENLKHVAEQLEKDKELLAKVKGAMMYPIVVLSASFILGLVLSFVVLPKITPLFIGLDVELPFTTRMLIAFSEFIEAHGLIFFIGVVASTTILVWLAKQKFTRPVTHFLLIHVPILKKIIRNKNRARFARTLGTLLRSGLTIDEALEITTDTLDNFYYRRALRKVSKRIGKGSSLSDNLFKYTDLFPVMLVSMIHVGEESGRLDETLLYLSRFYEMEVDTATKTLATAIEPILLLFIGIVVAFLALSIITPIYNITGNIQG